MGAEQLDFILKSVGGTTTEAYLRGIVNAVETEELAGEYTLTLTFSPYDLDNSLAIGKYPEDSGTGLPLLMINKWIVISDRARQETRSFIIRSLRTIHTAQSGIQYEVYCEHKKYALLDQVVRASGTYSNLSADDFMSLILADVTGGFTVGTNDIPVTELRTVELTQPTILGALRLLHDTWSQTVGGYELRFYPIVNEDGTIDLLREDGIGSTVPQSFEFSHSISGVTKDLDASRMANRIFCPGLDNGIQYADNKRWYDPNAGTQLLHYYGEFYRFDGGSGADENPIAMGSMITLQLHFHTNWLGGTGYMNLGFTVTLETDGSIVLFEFRDVSPDIAYPSLDAYATYSFYVGSTANIKRMTITNISTNVYGGASVVSPYVQRHKVHYELAPNVGYVDDAVSQALYGVVEANVENRDHLLVINVIRPWYGHASADYTWIDATLSNAGWSGGLNPLFTPLGSNTFTENTDPTYILHGTKSQKIVNASDAIGVSLSGIRAGMMLLEGHSYHAIFNLYIVAGSLRVVVYAGSEIVFDATTQGVGWVQLVSDTPFGPTESGQLQVYILSASAGGAEWYIDSLLIAQVAEAPPFYYGNSADELKLDAQKLLSLNKDPRAVYEINMLALDELGSEYGSYRFDVGDSVRVRDREAHIDDNLMVVRREANLFNIADRRLTLANRSARLIDVVNIASGTRSLRGT